MDGHGRTLSAWVLACVLVAASICAADEARIDVHADHVLGPVSKYITGACLEDVNHEVYGGIYSQMIYGESFQEPAVSGHFKQFTVIDGDWKNAGEGVETGGGMGPKLAANDVQLSKGEVSVEIFFADPQAGNSGLILKLNHPRAGADNFIGYEISLQPDGRLVLGRHRDNWEPIRSVPCKAPINQWVTLSVKLDDDAIEAFVDGVPVLQYKDAEHPLPPGGVALRAWQRAARFRNLRVITGGQSRTLAFDQEDARFDGAVSGMWSPICTGTAEGAFSLSVDHPFAGTQSQQIIFKQGSGEFGIENRGLNRWGMSFVSSKSYDGYLWLKCDQNVSVFVSAESGDGKQTYAEARIDAAAGDWRRYEFVITPNASDRNGRFSIRLKSPGSVVVGHAFLEPGEWGRFKGLPVRKDVADALVAERLTVLRYGGSMINDPQYRWKKMIGPRDRRPPYKGTWYPYSSNGFGIIDFLEFCEAAGFLPVPDLDNNESPQDIGDFIEYVNGPPDSPWGRKRAEDGHPAPFGLKYIELGNEEAVDETYWQKFKPLAEAIWAKDPSVTPVVGDFAYSKPIFDPYRFSGAPRIHSLAAHKKILDFAKEQHKPIWFDVHIWNDKPSDPAPQIEVLGQFIDWLGKISPGADYKVCVFEENANNHTFRRALAHARTINGLMRLGDHVPIVCAANCLQCDGQNDNGWDQGLLFLSSSRVWPQPSYYVTQMISRNRLPLRVETTVSDQSASLDADGCRSEDHHTLTLQVTNISGQPQPAHLVLDGFIPSGPAVVTDITGQPNEENTAADPAHIAPQEHTWSGDMEGGAATYVFPAHSFTLIRWTALPAK